jgi:CRISPR-associated exonuclease Cas4
MTTDPTVFAERIGGEDFAAWYREREWANNVRAGRPYFNGPAAVPPPERHSPSQLLQCHRKVRYRQENAPAEQPDPEGIFWTGRRFEEDVIVPYLQDVVRDSDSYVRNSMWVDLETETGGDPVRFRGATDPCIVDREAAPLLPTEVKTKEEIEGLDGPNRHHRAQVHAYMRGLSEKHDREIGKAVVIYGSRTTLDVRAFVVEFDPDFWGTVLKWAAEHTADREQGVLPPADPEYDWECGFCDYRHRCGQSDEPYADEGIEGFLPGYADYPREQVVAHLRAHEDATLTPTLARAYPDLAAAHEVSDWVCSACEAAFAWDADQLEDTTEVPPLCPTCAEAGTLTSLALADTAE